MIAQTKLESAIESSANIASGFIISFIVWNIIVWTELFEIQVNQTENLIIISIFTVTSWLRSYYWRRFFNAELHKVIHRFVTKLF